MTNPKKILVIQSAFIGDAILGTSVIEKLFQSFPDSKIIYLVRKGNESLFSGHPFLEEVWTFDKKRKINSLWYLFTKIRKEKFDVIVNLHRYASSNLLSLFSGAEMKCAFYVQPFSFFFYEKIKHGIGNGKHEIERNHSLIASWTDDKVAKPKLYPTEQDFLNVVAYKSQIYVCMAPASLWFTKQWPVEKWIELCRSIRDKKIYLLGGPADVSLNEAIVRESGNPLVKSLAGKLSFLESAALMKDAHMNFVNDSGPLHLASAVNAPTTAIFCSTVTNFGFTPLADISKVVQTTMNLPCRPCGLHGYKQCPQGHFTCGKSIPVENVWRT